ncbi:MAG: hypothetical protein ABF630_09780 [Liquorilactobacillus sp.]|uniref:hypothetical protein n=1 Tax=Liquorilactobacillus nagelii TaxID=82688 RepID=UPI0039EB6EB9
MNEKLIDSIAKLIGSKRPAGTSRIDELKSMTGLDESSLESQLQELESLGYLSVKCANNGVGRITVSTSFPK